jgi:APA family basic amino acid/polyamine antiporter
VHPRYRTPWIAILVFSGVASLTLIPGETDLLATMYSFGAMLSFTIAHLAVIRLRQKEPDHERPWKPPLNFRAFGSELPLTAVLGGLGTFAAWVVVLALNPRGIAVYLLYRRRQGLPITQTVKVVLPEPLGVEEVEYASVLVAFDQETPFSDYTFATAAKLGSRKRRAIHVLSLVEVPSHLPLDAPLDVQESEAQAKIERAKLIGGMRVTGHVHRVRPNQAGHAISKEARKVKASAIVLGLRYRNGVPLYGKTLQTVLAERIARVIVVGEPGPARAAAAKAAAPVEASA